MKTLLEFIAKIGFESAFAAGASASMFGCYQVEEPESLQYTKK